MNRYAVFQRRDEQPVRVGIVIANNYSHASTKAQQLYTRHSWVERIDNNQPAHA